MAQSLTGQEPERLELGDSGEWVLTLQIRLWLLGFSTDWPDGTYDLRTESAVRLVQSERGLDNDGAATVAVWEAILYLEQQAAIDYYWTSPYNALDQLRHDLENPVDQAGQRSADGRYQWDGAQWQEIGGSANGRQVSADGQWEWDGTNWVATNGGGGQSNDNHGQLSEDGQWQWNGTEWIATDGGAAHGPDAGGANGGGAQAEDYRGQLSEDGQWRWDGTQWRAA
ncbi:MAG: peptidoglycan-binding domain-containing protein [Jatrophihabitans sp.]